MSAREENRIAFNEQMNAWVSRQGLWFQLRHAADGQTIMARISRMLLRLLILLVIVAFVFWIYLVKRVESDGFRESIRVSLESSLKGVDCKVGGLKKERDIATLAFAKMGGTDDSFFHSLDARGIKTSMALTDGLLGAWKGKSLTITRFDINLKAGAGDDAEAAASFESLFIDQKGFEFDLVECKDANFSWGYSDHNLGFISGSHLTAARENDGWRVELSGGTFGQNWLNHLSIKKMVILCYRQGVTIQSAELMANDGTGKISFRAAIGSGSQPSIGGTIKLESMPLKALLPQSYTEWIDGVISGTGLISGSTNSQEGIVLDLDLKLEDGDVFSVRDSIPILSALSVVDLYNSYRKISFSEGDFHVRTRGELLEISKLNLKAGDLLHLRGAVDVRPPTHREIAKALDIEDVKVVSDILQSNWKLKSGDITDTDTGSSLSKSGDNDQAGSKNKPETAEEAVRNILKSSIMTELNVERYNGDINIGLKPDAFDKASKLKAAYPVDTTTNRIWLDIPLAGRLQTLTLKQAEQLYILWRSRE